MDALARFEALLDEAEKGRLRGLSFDELRELGRLYRVAAARLSRERERGDDPETIRHLNALCVRAFGLLYARSEPRPSLRRVIAERLPDALARTWRVQLLAWLLLGAGTFLGAALAARENDAIYSLVPSSLGYEGGGLEQLVQSADARAAFLAREEQPLARNALFGSALFTHNTRIGLLSFATGILAGVPTVLLQIYNGLVLGAFGWLFLRDPWPLDFLSWILPHAIPELTAIALCSAAGLLLGGAVATPGRGGRAAALRASVDPALLLFGASLPLFAVAAGIESFLRESTLGVAPRLAVAAAGLAALIGGLAWVRGLAHRRLPDSAWLGDLTGPARGSPGSGSTPAP
jgi:uncharacterized membrane protein SpoIIM required for sporulation